MTVGAEPVQGRVARVLERLTKVRKSGGQWTARCPAHDDRNPSLSVREGADGRVLIKCHGGCAFPEILAAVGLTPADCFPDETPAAVLPLRNRSGIRAEYVYTDENDVPLFKAIRTDDKRFSQHRWTGDAWTPGLGDTRRVLYRLPRVIEALAAEKRVYIVEGEKDVETLERHGLVATTNPMGAGKWKDEFSEVFRGTRDVVVLPDNDDAGRQHAEHVRDSLVRVGAAVRVVALPDLQEKGDVSDWLASGRTVDELEAAINSIGTMPAPPRASERTDAPAIQLARPLSALIENPELLREPAIEIPYLVVENATTLVAAREKAGKTTLVSQAISARIDGAEFLGANLGEKPPCNVLWLAIDEPLRDTVIRFKRTIGETGRIFISDEPRTLPELLTHLRANLEARPYAIVVVDTISRAFQQSGIKTNDPDVVGASVRLLVDIFREFSVSGLLIYHTNKKGDEYSGAVSIGASVDEIVILKRPRRDDEASPQDGDDDEQDDGKRFLVCRGRRLRESRRLIFVDGRYQFDEGKADSNLLRILRAATGDGAPFKKSELAAAAKGRRKDTLEGIDKLRARGDLSEHAGRYAITASGRKRLGQAADVEVDLAI